MARFFGHEKLKVYQKGLRFAVMRRMLLDRLPRRVAACDHLGRASESVVFNIAHASGSWSLTERVVYLGYANGSALECAACLDILVAKRLLDSEDATPGKVMLAEIVSMLVSMRTSATERIRESEAGYHNLAGNLFSHEGLRVYQAGLNLISALQQNLWVNG